MRVVRVSYRVPPMPGGMERHIECLTREQIERGHEVAIAFRHGSVVPAGARRLALRRTGMSPTMAIASDRLAFAAEATRAVRDLPGTDLVHLHGDHVEALVLGPACRRLGVPLVLTVHAALASRYPHPRLARTAFRLVDAFIALGSTTAADLVARGVDPRRIRTMSSGLNLSGMPPPTGIPGREPGLIVSVGALNPMKNHGLLIEAFHELRRTRPGLRLVIAGEGPERARLTQLAGRAGAVELPGDLPRDEVYRLVGRAELFVLASRRVSGKGEGVPTAALEALALGTPVVVSSDASLDPVVPDRAAYRVFGSGSLPSLIGAVRTLLDDGAARQRMSLLGARAAAALDWPSVADRVEELYRAVLNRRHSFG